jgi:hypothetical protein
MTASQGPQRPTRAEKAPSRSRAPFPGSLRTNIATWLPVALLVIGVIAAVIWQRANTGPRDQLDAVDDPPPFSHIHGLGVDPADDALYVATHGGLFRVKEGRASVVANRYQDTMGFLVVGPKHFVASGHPDLREDLPPLLGFLESRDAGKTWMKKSLLGESDLHALRWAHDRIWAYDSSSSELMVSEDGKTWDTRSSVIIRDFVVAPDSADLLIATNGEGLRTSSDGGRTWGVLAGPAAPVLLSWERMDELWLVTAKGEVHVSRDGGRSWKKRGGVRGQPSAFVAYGDSLSLALHDEVFRSDDGGRRWSSFYKEGQG